MSDQTDEKHTLDDGPTFTPFDSFAAKLLELSTKWVPLSKYVSLNAATKTLVEFNPFRIYLGIFFSNDGPGSIRPVFDGSDANVKLLLAISGDRYEFYPGKDAPLAMQKWVVQSNGVFGVSVLEGIYRGNTLQRGNLG